MTSAFERRAIVGALIWIGLLAIGLIGGRQLLRESPNAIEQLSTYVTVQRRPIELISKDYYLSLNVGDPVFLANSDQPTPVGIVSYVKLNDTLMATEVIVSMYGSSPPVTEADHFEFHYAPDSSEWLMRTMLTDEKKEEIRQLIQKAYQDNQAELVRAFRPLIEASVIEVSELLQEDLQLAIAARQAQLEKIGDRYQAELLKQELIPLFQDEIWPVVREECEPLANQIGQEIWKEVSMFSFGWRYLYDRSPLPEKNLTEKKFQSFVQQKVEPILASHVDDFLAIQRRLTRRIANNDRVKATLSNSLRKVASDPEIQQLTTEIFREVLVENTRLRDALQEKWRSPEAKQALAIANSRLDPVIRKIGSTMFGTPQEGITPEFAKVLRRRILRKDAKWLTLHIADVEMNAGIDRTAPFPESLPVTLSKDDTSFPIAPSRLDN